MARLSLSLAWDETRAVLARDGSLFAAVALALIVFPQTALGLFEPQASAAQTGEMLLFLTITIVIGFIAQVALNRLALGPSTTVAAAIGRGLERTPALVACFLILIAALCLVLLIIGVVLGAAGLMVAPETDRSVPAELIILLLLLTAFSYTVFQLTIPVAAAEQGGPIRLFSRALELARGNYWRLFAFVLLVVVGIVVVLLAGEFAFGAVIALLLGPPTAWSVSALLIGLETALIQAVFSVIAAVMLARIYAQLSGPQGEAQASVPTTGI